MATSTQSLITSVTTDQGFRDFCTGVSTGLQAAGLTQTSDTGQINLSTVTKPATTNTSGGYQIYRFSDALQSTHPVFIRVEYATAASASSCSLNISTGTSTNGAGVLGGQTSTQVVMRNLGSVSTANFYFSGDGSRIAMAGGFNVAGAANNMMWCVERLRNSSGANTADGHYLFVNAPSQSSATTYQQVVPASGSVIAQGTGRSVASFMPSQSLSLGSDLYVSSIHPTSYQTHNPCVSFVKYYSTDLTALTDASINLYSTAMTFKPLGAIFPSTTFSYHFSDNSGIAIRWE